MAKFVLKNHYEYWWPVKVRLPNPDKGGAFIEQTFNAKFRSMSPAKAMELGAGAGDEGTNAFIKEVVMDWDETIVDDDGDTVAFSEAALEDLLANVWVLRGFWAAWSESITGEPSARAKK
ncbi:MAG TPA: hypothetical protein VL133_02880 [Devosia sp.]|nr:hypothetical protein [Devosia sp.]